MQRTRPSGGSPGDRGGHGDHCGWACRSARSTIPRAKWS